jgi:hypothetical protein
VASAEQVTLEVLALARTIGLKAGETQVLTGVAPGRTQDVNAAASPTVVESAQRQQFRDSIDRAIAIGSEESEPVPAVAVVGAKQHCGTAAHCPRVAGPRRSSAALRTDPVARRTGTLVLILLSTALSIGVTIWGDRQVLERRQHESAHGQALREEPEARDPPLDFRRPGRHARASLVLFPGHDVQ